MKTFATYYFENDKTYQFKIKLAGIEPTKETMDRIKNAVDVYQVESIGKAKRTPISEQPEFHRLGPVESHVFEIEVKYPATDFGVKRLIVDRAGIPAANILVAVDGAEFVAEEQDAEDDAGKQDMVGDKRTESMLKDFTKNSVKFDIAEEK